MAKRKANDSAGSEALSNSANAFEHATPKTELPAIGSPSISPAKTEIAAEPMADEPPDTSAAANEASAAAQSAEETICTAAPKIEAPKHPRFNLRRRHKHLALFAASVAIAAAFGAVVGAAATGSFSKPVVDVAVEENKATQQSVARLAKEITNLKASLDAASKSAHSQIAKISERLSREAAEVTGSIMPPRTLPPAAPASATNPAPRPAPVAAEAQPPRLPIVADWSIRETRDGYVYVQGHGDVYQVVPGAPLPGLGPVEQIKRQDGRWLVVTPKGLIVSMRDRRYFEQF
jgi:hypothetical protein